MGGISDTGAHQQFEHADFFIPELLLKELWYDVLQQNCACRYKFPVQGPVGGLWCPFFYSVMQSDGNSWKIDTF